MLANSDFKVALIAGGCAGTSVDVALFPLDTIKTRLQSQQGFWKAGGFRGIYSGLASATIGSAPTAALFFCSYEMTKMALNRNVPEQWTPVVHMLAASLGEITACLLRVPVEVVKQRTQASPHLSSLKVFRMTIQSEGLWGLYRGYKSTVFREIPFSLIQFPIWEYLKLSWSRHQHKQAVDPWQSALCGAVAGAISSGLTTPLDVAKTRIMLAEVGTPLAKGDIPYALKLVFLEKGFKGLYAGLLPRVTWISVGGAIFLGMYDKAKIILNKLSINAAPL